MVDMLGFISDQLGQLGIPYEFGEWTGEISYPYFVGSFNEIEHRLEDDIQAVYLHLTVGQGGQNYRLQK